MNLVLITFILLLIVLFMFFVLPSYLSDKPGLLKKYVLINRTCNNNVCQCVFDTKAGVVIYRC